MPDWLRPHRTEAACDRILAAAGELFAERGVESVGMNEVARAAGCSRATLYRYFDNREALHAAYVHQQARALNLNLAELVSEISARAIDCSPRSPTPFGWYGKIRRSRHGSELHWAPRPLGLRRRAGADSRFPVVRTSRRRGDPRRRARWLVRVLTSFLAVPGRDADDERAMLKEFVIPVVLSASVLAPPTRC